MLNAIFKSAMFQTLIPIVFMVIIGRTLYLSLKYGVVVGGKWGEKIYKNEKPVFYWFCVSCYAGIFGCSLFMLIIVVKAYYFSPQLPSFSN